MPKYRVTGPDGQTYDVTAPEGASEQEVMDYVRAQVEGSPSERSTIDDVVRSLASGLTVGAADEIAAVGGSAPEIAPEIHRRREAAMPPGLDTLGRLYEETPRGSYGERLEAERAQTEAIPGHIRYPAEIAGGVMTGTGLAKGGVSFLNAAKPTIGSLAARGAAEGAAYGGAYGLGTGEGGARERLESAAYGAGLGALTGAGTGALSRALVGKTVKTGAQVAREQGRKAYETAERAGIIVKSDSFGRLVDRIQRKLARAGIDKTLHPKALAAFNRLDEAKVNNQTLEGLDILRQVARDAAGSNEAAERRIAKLMVDEIDNYISGLQPKDVVMGNVREGTKALREARTLWTRYRKGEVIERLIERAGNRAGQFTGSGYENALRTEFRQLAQNEKRFRLFTPEEKKAIQRVARGGPIENVLRRIGSFAARGPVSSAITAGGGAAIGGPLGAGAAVFAGEAGRQGATAMTVRNAQEALNKVLGGIQAQKATTLTPTELMALRSILIGEAQQAPEALPMSMVR